MKSSDIYIAISARASVAYPHEWKIVRRSDDFVIAAGIGETEEEVIAIAKYKAKQLGGKNELRKPLPRVAPEMFRRFARRESL